MVQFTIDLGNTADWAQFWGSMVALAVAIGIPIWTRHSEISANRAAAVIAAFEAVDLLEDIPKRAKDPDQDAYLLPMVMAGLSLQSSADAMFALRGRAIGDFQGSNCLSIIEAQARVVAQVIIARGDDSLTDKDLAVLDHAFEKARDQFRLLPKLLKSKVTINGETTLRA